MLRTLALLALLASPIQSFAVAGTGKSKTAVSASTELKPSYDIEPVSIRIGHGFDIHRMAPIGDAGQPIIIGGVEITHKDQKVCDAKFHSMTKHNLEIFANSKSNYLRYGIMTSVDR